MPDWFDQNMAPSIDVQAQPNAAPGAPNTPSVAPTGTDMVSGLLNFNPNQDPQIDALQGATKSLISHLKSAGDTAMGGNAGKALLSAWHQYMTGKAPDPGYDWDGLTKTNGGAQKLGAGLESAAEFAVPSSLAGDALKAAPAIAKIATQAGIGAGVTKGQGGTNTEAIVNGGLGGVGEAVSSALGAGKGFLKNWWDKIKNTDPISDDQLNALQGLSPGGAGIQDVPLGDKTGNKFVNQLQKAVGHSFIGADVASDVERQTQSALSGYAKQLTGSGSTADANTNIVTGLKGIISKLSNEANQGYADFRTRASSVANQKVVGTSQPLIGQNGMTMISPSGAPLVQAVSYGFPVDMSNTQNILKPIYDEMSRQVKAGALPEESKKAYVLLDQIMNADQSLSADQADKFLGGLKSIARTADSASFRNQEQGLAAKAVGLLQKNVDDSISSLDPQAQASLRAASTATRKKYEVGDILDDLGWVEKRKDFGGQDPFRKFTGNDTRSSQLLSRISAADPSVKQSISEGLLQNVFANSIDGSNYKNGQTAVNNWNAIGNKVKQQLFGSNTQNIDDFIAGAARLGKNPNSSNTGAANQVSRLLDGVGAGASGMGILVHHPEAAALAAAGTATKMAAERQLAKLLYQPDTGSGLAAIFRDGVNSPSGKAALATLKNSATALKSGTQAAIANQPQSEDNFE